MANLIKFESVNTIEKNREGLREARNKVIESAKEKHEKDERRKAEAKRRGEDTWMLSSVNQRVEAEEEAVKKSKKKKKKKEKHKKQKDKKRKKKKKHETSSSSDSSSEDDDEPTWVEKSEKKKESSVLKEAIKGPKMERESWMSAPLDLVPTVTRQDLMDLKNKEKKELEEQKRLLEQPGRHAKELNPYWKDGGSGLPEEKRDSKPVTVGPGDSGLSWLRKSYQRCIEQAKEEGRTVEELAAERWGSLEKIQTMISDAEKLALGPQRNDRSGERRNRFMKPGDSERSDSYRHRSDSQRDRSDRNSERSDRNSERSDRNSERSDRKSERSDRNSERSDRNRSRRSRSRSPSRQSNSSRHRSRSSERSHGYRKKSRSRSQDRNDKTSRGKDLDSRSCAQGRPERSRSRDKLNRSRSRERYRRERSRSKERVSSSVRGRFMKPGEMSRDDNGSSYRTSKSSSGGTPAWRKKEFQKPKEEEEDLEKGGKREKREEHRTSEKDRRKRRASTSSSSSASSSSSESSSSDNEAEKGQRLRSPEPKVVQKILSEKEMNDLGAKILKAEIMGNKDQADKLKAQLEAAREARKNMPAGGEVERKDEKEDFIVLTRTDRSGMARPVPESKHERSSHSGKRKRKEKVETHSGKEGERVRYFADDDKYDLKTLVEREKMGTAEDQNSMFARLAGRAEKTQGDDFQVDDIFLTKANRKQAESVEEERDRARAIMEHRQMASSMEKCHFCFNRVEKHLIIAIGTKVYLSLPATKSLTEGHCLIVPMQHVSSGTTVDEDVWSEIQLFRKTLTKLFNDRDEDVVFMELSMNLKYFPHMCIECVPMEKEIGDMAPIYFKKALQDTGSEWAENKKVVDISQKDIRHSVPKGFPYFSVDFGNEGGFAHVIEDEKTFPSYFGKEIIGGMIDADHSLWRKPHKENFDNQRKKVLRFSEMWKPYDWTQNLSKKTQNDSDSSSSSDSD